MPWFIPYGIDARSQLIIGSLLGIPSGLAGGSIALLIVTRSEYLIYDVRTRTIRGPSFWKLRTQYPRAGYDRLEYSAYDARLYEVRADGKRRRLIFKRWVADRHDWKTLADLLLTTKGPRNGADRE